MHDKIYTYKVGIPAAYFPSGTKSKDCDFSGIYEVVHIRSISRTEAAKKAWKKHYHNWLPLMNPKQTTIRIISLYVNDPKIGTSGNMTRLSPIKVYQD